MAIKTIKNLATDQGVGLKTPEATDVALLEQSNGAPAYGAVAPFTHEHLLAEITDAGDLAALDPANLPAAIANYRGQGDERMDAAFAAVAGAGSLPVDDTTALVRDPGDNTKLVRIDAGAISTETTRVIIMGDRNVDLAVGGTFAEKAQGDLADSAVQPDDLGALAALDQVDDEHIIAVDGVKLVEGTVPGGAIGEDQIGSSKLADVITGGSATNANITWNSKGQITAAENGSGGAAPTPAAVVLNDPVTQLVPATHGDHLNKLILTPAASSDDFVYWLAEDIAAASIFRFRSRTSGRVFVHRPPSTLGYDNPSGSGFVVGEFIEDQSSGARGQIVADNGSTTLSLVMVTGTFGNNNQIVGDDSGHTADVDGSITDNGGTVNGAAFVAIGTVEHGSAGYTALVEVESNAGTAPVIAVEGETAEATSADADHNMDGHELQNAVITGGSLGDALNAADKNISAPRLIDTAEVAPAATVSGSVTRDYTAGQVQELTLSNDVTDLAISNPPGAGNAGAITFIVHTATFDWAHPTGILWPDDGDAPTMTADGTDIITYITRDAGTTWYGFVGGLDFA